MATDSSPERSGAQSGARLHGWAVPLAFAVFVAGVIALGIALHFEGKRAAEQAASETLRVTSELSAHSLDTWLAERSGDAEAIGSNPLLVKALDHWWQGDAQRAEYAPFIQKHLEGIRRVYGYRSIAIVDVGTDKAVFSSGAALDAQQLGRVAQAGTGAYPRWIELPAESGAGLRLALARSIADSTRGTGHVLYMEMDLQWLVDTLAKARLPNWGGETILVHRDARGLQILAAASGPGLQALQGDGPVVESLLTEPGVSAAQGRNRDGVEVMARRENILLPSWMVLSLMPEKAVYAAVTDRSRLLVLGAAVLILFGSLLYAAWRRGDRHRHAAREAGLRRHYEHVMRDSTDIFFLTDNDGTILDVSQAAVDVYGYPRGQLIGMNAQRLRPPDNAAAQAAILEAMQPGESRHVRIPRLRADGSTFLLEGTVGCFESEGQRYFVGIGRDITRQAEVETQLRVAASFFSRSAVAIVVGDRDKRVVSINPHLTRITGYTLEDLQGQPTVILNAGLDPAGVERARAILKAEDFWEGEMHIRRKDGTAFPARLLVCAHRGADGQVEQHVDLFTDLTRLKQAESQAQYLAIHDPVTGLPNRARLEQELPLYIAGVDAQAASPHNSLSLALVNLDRFKGINESFGYAQGDVLLVEIARRLQGLSADLKGLYRYGGDEFMLVLSGNPVTHALLISQVRALLSPPIRLGPQEHPVSPTASIGIASYPEHAHAAEDLLHNVEAAMRIAKVHGRNTWRLYAPEMNASAYDHMLLAVDLRQAIDVGELELHLQPQFTLSHGQPVGMEALLRWTHKTRGPVSPARFIPIAESSGMIAEIGNWVLREAARIWSRWRSEGLAPLPIAVNLSAVQFQAPDFLHEVGRVISEFDLPAGALEMELTEGTLMDNTDAAVDILHQLVGMGIQIAIDDFGTGYSSLSYLRRFPVSKLKIDRSFILDLGKHGNEEAEAIASAVIAMAKSLKLRVIAEGVETPEQRDFLKDHGCDEVQGYLYARPMSVEALTALLARRPAAGAQAQQQENFS
ncbi:EAL domain-containing protein [Acidovorax sp.]|uniref:bifunctional diguanylate cyclase/phosphodiesterase n=1 Tax=Acidovorax sp. TaxID=1872122 RepID=UPI00391F05F3